MRIEVEVSQEVLAAIMNGKCVEGRLRKQLSSLGTHQVIGFAPYNRKPRGSQDKVICLLENGVPRYFEGRVDGQILTERYGKEGFGYDPIFMPDRFAVSFAEMPMEVKNRISHRGRAVAKLTAYLKEANS